MLLASHELTHADAIAEDIQNRMRKLFPGMPKNAYVEATIVPGIYAMRVPSFQGCTPYVDAEVTMIANNGVRGWTMVGSNREVPAPQMDALGARIYASVSETLPVVSNGTAPPVGILLSGVDCAPSALSEKALKEASVSYRLLPTALQAANISHAVAAACSPDAAAAWPAAREGRRSPSNAACRIDARAMKDISCMLMGGRLPTLLQSNGQFSRTLPDIERMARAGAPSAPAPARPAARAAESDMSVASAGGAGQGYAPYRASNSALDRQRGTTTERDQQPSPVAAGDEFEVFGIRIGAEPSWRQCQKLLGRPVNSPCADINGSFVTFWFDSATSPAMLKRLDLGGGLINRRVASLLFSIRRGDKDEHINSFIEKFGTPSVESVPMHNSAGGSWIGDTFRWNRSGTTITVGCTSFGGDCTVSIETPGWQAFKQQNSDRRQKL